MSHRDCTTCQGTGHVDHHVCDTCGGYGQFNEAGERCMSRERLMTALNRYAASQGWPYGMPIPALNGSSNRLAIAKRAPFGDRKMPTMPEMMGAVVPRELRELEGLKVVNCWHNRDGMLVLIMESKDGKRVPYVGEHPCVERFHMMIETAVCRTGAVRSRAEVKAFMNLAERLNETQVDSYLLNGSFIETSKRSGVKYVFRKGLPTIALSREIKFLAALCLHPLAYYENTFAGSMAPSDEVLTHLLLMRSDEHRLWKESNQHPLWAIGSGL